MTCVCRSAVSNNNDNACLSCTYYTVPDTGTQPPTCYLIWSSWQPSVGCIIPSLQWRMVLREAEGQNQNQTQLWLTPKPIRSHFPHPLLLVSFIITYNNTSSRILSPKYCPLTSIFPMLKFFMVLGEYRSSACLEYRK